MKTYRPTSPGKRHQTTVSYRNVLTRGTPEKSLTKGFKRNVGRNIAYANCSGG
jgi:ribosomal protein L2